MPNADSLAAISTLILIQSVDEARPKTETFKLFPWLRLQVNGDLAALEAADSDTALTESDRTGGSGAARGALDALQALARDGFNFIKGIPSFQIKPDQRAAVFAAYGWAGGKLGDFSDARTLGLARLAARPAEEVGVENAAWRYSPELVKQVQAQLKVYDDNHQDATGADRQGSTRARDEKLTAAQTTISQVRHFYCAASRELDQTPELARIGMQPRRDRGMVAKAAGAGKARPGGTV